MDDFKVINKLSSYQKLKKENTDLRGCVVNLTLRIKKQADMIDNYRLNINNNPTLKPGSYLK